MGGYDGLYRFGVVVDRKTLNKMLVSVASVFVTIVSFVLALQPDKSPPLVDGAMGTDTCMVLNAAQKAALVSFRAANQSCTYNITVNGDGF